MAATDSAVFGLRQQAQDLRAQSDAVSARLAELDDAAAACVAWSRAALIEAEGRARNAVSAGESAVWTVMSADALACGSSRAPSPSNASVRA
jgi:hypothetical protein